VLCFVIIVCTLQNCGCDSWCPWTLFVWHNVVCVVCTVVPIIKYWSSSTLLCAFVYVMLTVVQIFFVCLCFLCAFCNAQSQSMKFNTQGCYITTWCALCSVHPWCVYICRKFQLCALVGNPNLLSLSIHCVHQMGLGVQCACKTTEASLTSWLVYDKCSLLAIEAALYTFQCY
jgi:hypothetical protein